MKTTAHLHRHQAPPSTPAIRPSTMRLGVLVSVFAATAAILVHLLTDLPTAAIVIPVVLIGFTLSWFTTGQRDRRDNASTR